MEKVRHKSEPRIVYDLLETVEILLGGYRHLINKLETSGLDYPDQWQFEEIAEVYKGVDALKNADHYVLGPEFEDMIDDYSAQFDNMVVSDIVLGPDTRPPSKLTFIVLAHQLKRMKMEWDESNLSLSMQDKLNNLGKPPEITGGYMCEQFEDGSVYVKIMHMGSAPYYIGMYKPNGSMVLAKDAIPTTANTIAALCAAFDIVNQPRFTVSETDGTRQQRRSLNKSHGIAVESWHKISWNVDDELDDKDAKNQRGGWHMPLHYTRGHWRRAKPHWDNVVIRRDGNPYKWIEGFWSGHPAYGIKKGYHAPTTGRAA